MILDLPDKKRQDYATYLEDMAKVLRYGCSDGNCVIEKKTGMHTNGGCRCKRIPGALLEIATDIEDAFIRGRDR